MPLKQIKTFKGHDGVSLEERVLPRNAWITEQNLAGDQSG
jgi:hypothetical protein